MKKIYPSLLGLRVEEMRRCVPLMVQRCDGFHLDIMDGVFVPYAENDSKEFNELIKKYHFVPWVHLMVEDVERFFNELFLPEGSLVSFHCEINQDKNNIIKKITEKKCRAGIVINPKTPIFEASSYFGVVDQVLLMSVEPGRSGQCFLKSSLDRLNELVDRRKMGNYLFRIGMDGGINTTNILELAYRGVDDFAIGGGIFLQSDPLGVLQELYTLLLSFK